MFSFQKQNIKKFGHKMKSKNSHLRFFIKILRQILGFLFFFNFLNFSEFDTNALDEINNRTFLIAHVLFSETKKFKNSVMYG